MFRRARRRSTTRQTVSGPEISIPAKFHLFTFLFLSIWLVLWAFGQYFGWRTLSTRLEASTALWFAGWTFAGGFALYVWLWMIAGREIISLRPGVLAIRRSLLGYVRVREYDLRHVSNLRVDPEPYDAEYPGGALLYWFGAGPIAFDYAGRTIRFAGGVNEPEAHEIVALLSGAP